MNAKLNNSLLQKDNKSLTSHTETKDYYQQGVPSLWYASGNVTGITLIIYKWKRVFGLTWGDLLFQIALIDGVQDKVHVTILPDEVTHVFLFVHTVKEKTGFDKAFVFCFLHKGNVTPRVLAAGAHAVPVSGQFGRRNERRSVFYGLIGVDDEVLFAFLEALQTFTTLLATSGVEE